MFSVKHLMDATSEEDGERLYVEAGGLTKDLAEWCAVDYVLSYLGPPQELVKWFETHPSGYEYFRAKYHEALSSGPDMKSLRQLVVAAIDKNFTLLHTGDNPQENTATALYEFLAELEAHLEPGAS
jgi:uncharacterized protein YeaO (DUF488 family)